MASEKIPEASPSAPIDAALDPSEQGPKMGRDEFGDYRIDDKVWTMNEIRDHPMFMEDMPRDISDNPTLLALQSLVYDDQTPEELAEHFKNLGNEAFNMKEGNLQIALQNALACYTRGLEMEGKDDKVNSTLHSNRAAVSMRVKEYSKAVNDCRTAIKLDVSNLKAYFRAAKASESMGLTSQALGFVNDASKVHPEAKDIKVLHAKLSKQLREEEKSRAEARQAAEMKRADVKLFDAKVRETLERRDVRMGGPLFDISMYMRQGNVKPTLAEDDPEAVCWAMLMLYDEVNQSDFVDSFDERASLDEQMQIMFPEDRHAHWDEEEKYVWNRLVAYLEVYNEDGDGTIWVRLVNDQPLYGQLVGHRVPPVLGLHVFVADSPALETILKSQQVYG